MQFTAPPSLSDLLLVKDQKITELETKLATKDEELATKDEESVTSKKECQHLRAENKDLKETIESATLTTVVEDRRNNNIDGLLLTTLPVPLLMIIVNNLGTQEDLVTISVLSKLFYEIVHLPAINTKIVKIYEINPSKINGGSGRKLVQRLAHNQLNNNEKFSQYHHLKVNRFNEFDCDVTITTGTATDRIEEIISTGRSIFNIESLDLSLSSSSPSFQAKAHILFAMQLIFENLQEINLSYIRIERDAVQRKYYPMGIACRTKEMTWHHCDRDLMLDSFGSHTTSIQLFSDDSLFLCSAPHRAERMSNLEQHDGTFIFCDRMSLECLSIRNARYTYNDGDGDDIVGIDVPQSMLIKYVRNAPLSLRWFRSNLTKENRSMLQKERPEIQLVN